MEKEKLTGKPSAHLRDERDAAAQQTETLEKARGRALRRLQQAKLRQPVAPERAHRAAEQLCRKSLPAEFRHQSEKDNAARRFIRTAQRDRARGRLLRISQKHTIVRLQRIAQRMQKLRIARPGGTVAEIRLRDSLLPSVLPPDRGNFSRQMRAVK